ncbi:hypothetical protein M8J77_016412 [Diaphorina citri]|nr:hypothetical protein M8J77_016412 [Diaphorina citri]
MSVSPERRDIVKMSCRFGVRECQTSNRATEWTTPATDFTKNDEFWTSFNKPAQRRGGDSGILCTSS